MNLCCEPVVVFELAEAECEGRELSGANGCGAASTINTIMK